MPPIHDLIHLPGPRELHPPGAIFAEDKVCSQGYPEEQNHRLNVYYKGVANRLANTAPAGSLKWPYIYWRGWVSGSLRSQWSPPDTEGLETLWGAAGLHSILEGWRNWVLTSEQQQSRCSHQQGPKVDEQKARIITLDLPLPGPCQKVLLTRERSSFLSWPLQEMTS